MFAAMSKTAKTILIVGVVGLALWYFTTQAARVDVGAAAISRLKLEGGNLRINVKIPILNRADFPVPVSGFLGNLLYGGAPIGTTSLVGVTTLQGRAQTILEFTTVVSLLSVATSTPLLNLLNSLADKYIGVSLPGLPAPTLSDLANSVRAIRIRGTLYLGAIGFDINEPLTV